MRLVLLRAPGGFGKTTLMQQYHAAEKASGRHTLWLSLDSSDNDLPRFVEHLEAGAAGLPDEDNGDAEFSERIAASSHPVVIFLDEFEAIHAPPVLDYVRRLLDLLPNHSLLVIASRTMPDLNLGRLRTRGQMLEIGPAALRFSLDEATAFVREQRRLPLQDDDIARLHRSTDGWVAALFLATLSLESRTDYAAFVASFSGSNRELAQYLAEDVLARQDAESRDFLLRASVLGPLCAELCDAALGRRDSARMLEAMEQANLFLFRVDEAGTWYRFHSLFAEFLRDRLNKDLPGAAPELHRAAADWHIRAGHPVQAVEHLLEAHANEEALDIIASCVGTLRATGRVRLLARWFDQIPHALLARRHDLLLDYAWAVALNRRFTDATRLLESPTSAGSAQARALQLVILAMTDEVQACCELGEARLERLPPDDYFNRAAVANAYAWGLAVAMRHDEALAILARAAQHDQDHEAGFMLNVGASIEIHIDLMQGQLNNARARLALDGRHGVPPRHGTSPQGKPHAGLAMPLAVALYECGEYEETAHLLGAAMPYVKSSGTNDSLIISHVLTARLATMRGDTELARRTLAELEALGRGEGGLRIVCSAWLERARQATLDGEYDAAQRALRSAGLTSHWTSPELSYLANDVDEPFAARARLRVAMGDTAGLAEELSTAIERSESVQRRRRALKLRILLAMCLNVSNSEQPALDALGTALEVAAHEGFVSTFIEEGAGLMRLLKTWYARNPTQTRLAAFAARVIGIAGGPDDAPAASTSPLTASPMPTPPALLDPLTGREIEVLELLALGLRNKVIADRLFLSEFTVKSHLRNINSKLGATGRTEAVAIARRLGLLH
ncbi:LuxR family maltose regulon positive regulatory protein [Paraburkholderia unamae]|nr:LuxR family maltose regulon positive regulatory protein [Paraburkholderia unamae]